MLVLHDKLIMNRNKKTKRMRNRPELRLVCGKFQVRKSGAGPKPKAEKMSYIYPQAENLIRKFGGPRKLVETIKAICTDPNEHLTYSSVYRWLYPKEAGGTGGEVPLQSLKVLLRIARRAGVDLKHDDVYPRYTG